MSATRAQVRAAVAATFRGTDGLTSVYAAPPKVIDGSKQPAGVVHIASVTEKRVANQQKVRTYDVRLRLEYISKELKSEDAQADFDALVDALEQKLRSQKFLDGSIPTLGNAGEPTFKASQWGIPTTTEQGSTYISGELQFFVDDVLTGV